MFPAAEAYADFRKQHLPVVLSLREPADFHDPIPISERLVQVIWADQLFDAQRLRTRDGRSLRVLGAGRWNVEGGPDFTDARLEIDGRPLRGDIEVHLHASGWNEHGHSGNPAYARVILDVCLWDDGDAEPPLNIRGQRMSQLVVSPYLQSSLDELVESLDPDTYPFSTVRITSATNPLQRLPRQDLLTQVAAAGLYRFQTKATRMAGAVHLVGADQAAYQCLAEALGYKHNAREFHQIATAVPLCDLLRSSSMDGKIDLLLRESARHPLRLSQVRPANHPERRLAALALLAHAHPRMSAWFGEVAANPRALRQPPELVHPFWRHHAHRRARPFRDPVALVGATRWLDIVINVILPFVYAQAAPDDAGAANRLVDIYRQLPSSQVNLLSRRIAYDLQVAHPRQACLQQGLIQIYRDFDLLLPESLCAK